jgi:phage recombination protein Bet
MIAEPKTASTSLAIAPLNESALISVLRSSLYPGASEGSICLVLDYCKAARLDPMQKPVHIVPMWDSKAKSMRDVIMPGIGLYRTQAVRTNQYAGITEPEFGDDITAIIGGIEVTYPQWCRVKCLRELPSGRLVEFAAVERWLENYAVAGGPEKSVAPNAMWKKRPYGQLAKCAEAQALRKAFPELGAMPTAEEMQGKALDDDDVIDGSSLVKPSPVLRKEQPEKSKTTDDSPKAEAGMLVAIRNKLKDKNLDENALLMQFELEVLEGITLTTATEMMSWLRNAIAGKPQVSDAT